MHSAIENLVKLGLREYEAKIYVALVGIREANARTIHEVSGVPRPRVYDILTDLTSKGFVEVREGSPLVYRSIPPDVIVPRLQKEMDQAAEECIRALEALTLKTRQEYVPLWHVNGEWSINRHLKEIVDRTNENLRIFVSDKKLIGEYASFIAMAVQKCPVKILLKEGVMDMVTPVPGPAYYEIGEMDTYFRHAFFNRMFQSPITCDNAVFELIGSIISDERESILIYTYNGERMAIINRLPFLICSITANFDHIISGARHLGQGELNKGGNSGQLK
jgi:HTH-type transcriptional regulator, sugar sensing transcriptional regulator